jgi:hypothetical protein
VKRDSYFESQAVGSLSGSAWELLTLSVGAFAAAVVP